MGKSTYTMRGVVASFRVRTIGGGGVKCFSFWCVRTNKMTLISCHVPLLFIYFIAAWSSIFLDD